MEKTQSILDEIEKFKYSLNVKDYGYYIKYGSFYRIERRYITDIDIHFLTKDELNIDMVIDIVKKLNNNDNVKKMTIYSGYPDYYYNDSYKKEYFKKMYKEGIISKAKYRYIRKAFNNDLEHSFLKKIADNILELEWTIDDINKGYIYFGDKKYYFKDTIKSNFVWCDIVYKLNNGDLVTIEYIIMPKKNFKNQKTGDIYSGCKLAMNEYKINQFYNFIKRLKSCYVVMLKRMLTNDENREYVKKTFDLLIEYLHKHDKNISVYHKVLTDLKLTDDDYKIYKLNKRFNLNFKKAADKLYKEGVDKNLIY
jgi:hypothetical protein